MPNVGYIRSRNLENEIKHQFEREGFFATRSAGSHTPVDVLALRPAECIHPDHFEVKFIQVKSLRSLKKDSKKIKKELTAGGWYADIEYWNYAVRPKAKVGQSKNNPKGKDRQKNKDRENSSNSGGETV